MSDVNVGRMKKQCAWCRKDMGTVDASHGKQGVVSHGLCDDCAEGLIAELGMGITEYLDKLDAPVVVIDADTYAIAANSRARNLLKDSIVLKEGMLPGDVFDCVHASEPGGCGKTIHCSGCAIRNTVEDTFNTGKSYEKVPAVLSGGGTDNPAEIDLLISTEKVKDVVLLRVDELNAH